MADALNVVSPEVDARKKALLQAVASGGTAGLQAFESSEKAMTEARQQGVARAAERARLIGGPEAQGFESLAAGQYDRRIGDLGASRDAWTANMAHLGAANQNYLGQVAAAAPAQRSAIDRALAMRAARDEADDSSSSSSSSGTASDLLGEMSDSELGNYLFGAGRNAKADALTGLSSTKGGLGRMLQKTKVMGTTSQDAGKMLGTDVYGLDPNRVAGLPRLQNKASKPKPATKGTPVTNIMGWAKADEKTAKTIAASPKYKEARTWATQWLDPENYALEDGVLSGEGEKYDGLTPWQAFLVDVEAALPKNQTRTRRALLGEFEGLFRSYGLR